MQIKVEFYGIPRLRAGVAQAVAVGETLGDVLLDLAQQFPDLAEECFDGSSLKSGYTCNLQGDRFITAPSTKFSEGDSLLILTLDAGGC